MSDALGRLGVVVPTWNVRELLDACLAALAPAARAGARVVVVDDAGDDGSDTMVRERHRWAELVVHAQNLGFAAACNRGASHCSDRPYLLLLNADTEIEADAPVRLVEFLESRPEYAAAAPRLVDPSGATQRACMALPGLATALVFGTPLEGAPFARRELARYFERGLGHDCDVDVEQPPAAALCVRRGAWDALGGLDESLPVFFNDVDLCRRLRAIGGRIRFLAEPRVRHLGGASTRRLPDFAARWHADRLTYYRKHHGRVGAWAAKTGSTLAFGAHAAAQLANRARRRPAEPLAPITRAWAALLAS